MTQANISKLNKFVLTRDKDLIELVNAFNRLQGKVNQIIDVLNENNDEK